MSIELQRMIRDQANETRTQLHDMVSWEEEMQKRDDQLIELAKQGKFGYVPPDTSRMQATTTTSTKAKHVQIKTEGDEKPTEQKKNPVSKVPKSYEEWQKIDGKYKDFDENEVDPKESAVEHKEKGNNFYKKKQYSAAIREYSEAIRLDPSNAIFFNNRAAAHYQLSNYVESEKDATKAINLDGRYVKAYIRRGNARRVQGKLQGALEDFQVADDIEPGTPEIEKQLKVIREQLGISANGKITEVPEPKVKIIEDDEEAQKKPKIEVVEEEEPSKPRPKVEVIEERSFAPQEEEKRNKSEPKVEVVEEHTRHPKVEVIEEKSFSPEAEHSRIKIVSEEPAAPAPAQASQQEQQPSSSKIKIVSEEPEQPASSKIKIISEEPEQPASSKIKIVSEEPAEEKSSAKVKIVAEEETKPEASKIKVVSEEETKQETPKVQVVSEEPAKAGATEKKETAEVPKRQPRPENISISHPDLDEPAKPKPKPANTAKKGQGRVRQLKPFIDMTNEEVAERLKQMKPSMINQAIGSEVSPEIILKILKGLHNRDPDVAFQFIEQIGQHKLLSIALAGKPGALIKPIIIEMIEAVKDVDNVRKANVRKNWKID